MTTSRNPSLSFPFKTGGLIPMGHLALACTLALAATAWAAVLIDGPRNHEIESFLILVGVYGAGSAAFIASRMRFGQFRFFDLPTFITILAFVEFGLAPLGCLVTGADLDRRFHGDYEVFIHALVVSVLGMMAFWAGAHVFARIPRLQVAAPPGRESRAGSPPLDRPVICAVLLYCAAFLVKVYFLRNLGFGYGASEEVYFKHLAAMQVANVIFQLGTCALVILATERSLHPFSLERKVLFWLVLIPECFWGLVSGMKGTLLQNFLLVAIVSSLTERKLKKGWIMAACLGLVIIYPFSTRYRELVRTRSYEGMDFSSASQIGSLAFDEASKEDGTAVDWLGTGVAATLGRLDLLQSFALIMSVGPRAAIMKGDERWWMLPVYPFVPRFLWPTKPILDKGRRFSIALGYGDQTSTAITYPGDLYFEYGVPGVLVGMFLFGLAVQWLTTQFAGAGAKASLFIYTCMFIAVVFSTELDAFDFWCTLIRYIVLLGLVARIVYRRPPRLQLDRV